MTNLVYKLILDPGTEETSKITDGLTSFGLEQTGGDAPSWVAVVCKNHQSCPLGGAIGHSLQQRFYLTHLWVEEKSRDQGIGTELVRRVEEVASDRGCRDIVVDTLNGEAVSFYEHRGYRVYMVNTNYISGFDWHFLTKDLTDITAHQ